MEQGNPTKRGRYHSSPPDFNATCEPTLEGFGNVAGGPEEPELLLYLDISNNNLRSSNEHKQSSGLSNLSEHPMEDLPPHGDYSQYRDPTRSRVRLKGSRQAYMQETCSSQSSSGDETTNTACTFTSGNKSLKSSNIIENYSAATRKAPKLFSTVQTKTPVSPSISTEPSVLPQNTDSDVEPLLQGLANLKISGTVQFESYCEGKSRTFQTSQCVKPKFPATNPNSNFQTRSRTSGSGTNTTAPPTVTQESAATSVASLISDLYRYYGSRMSCMLSLNSDDRYLPSLLESLYSSMQAFKDHPESVIMFQMVDERRVALTLPKIRQTIIDVERLVLNYEMERHRASSHATLALEHINTSVGVLFLDLHPIDNEIQAALSMLQDEWGPTG